MGMREHPAFQMHTRNGMNLNCPGWGRLPSWLYLGVLHFCTSVNFIWMTENQMLCIHLQPLQQNFCSVFREVGHVLMSVRITHGIKLEWMFLLFIYFWEQRCWFGHPRSLNCQQSIIVMREATRVVTAASEREIKMPWNVKSLRNKCSSFIWQGRFVKLSIVLINQTTTHYHILSSSLHNLCTK